MENVPGPHTGPCDFACDRFTATTSPEKKRRRLCPPWAPPLRGRLDHVPFFVGDVAMLPCAWQYQLWLIPTRALACSSHSCQGSMERKQDAFANVGTPRPLRGDRETPQETPPERQGCPDIEKPFVSLWGGCQGEEALFVLSEWKQ